MLEQSLYVTMALTTSNAIKNISVSSGPEEQRRARCPGLAIDHPVPESRSINPDISVSKLPCSFDPSPLAADHLVPDSPATEWTFFILGFMTAFILHFVSRLV
ncbi:hypothetical protein K438DRAFT_100937 [Mycena galopus ATCC 62051]|nr:hypothetical protein K438DRAFT_100937 [Mycena galopus ATCC 62051]